MRTAESVLAAAHPGAPRPWGRWGLRATAISYLALIIVLPLSAIVATGFRDGLRAFWNDITNPTAFAAFRLTLTVAVLTTVISLVAGLTQLGLGSAFFRSYNYDYESQEDRAAVLSTVVILLSLVSIPVASKLPL